MHIHKQDKENNYIYICIYIIIFVVTVVRTERSDFDSCLKQVFYLVFRPQCSSRLDYITGI